MSKRLHIFGGTSHDPMGRFRMLRISKICVQNVLIIVKSPKKKNFEIRELIFLRFNILRRENAANRATIKN